MKNQVKDRELDLGAQTSSILAHVDALKRLTQSLSVQADFLSRLQRNGYDPSAGLMEHVRNFEISLIRAALTRTAWIQVEAARELRISPTTLHWKIKRFKLTKTDAPATPAEIDR